MWVGGPIRLRASEPADRAWFVRWANAPGSGWWSGPVRPVSLAEEEARWVAPADGVEAVRFTIDRQTGDAWQPVGRGALEPIDWHSRQARLTLQLGEPAAWDGPVAPGALALLLRYGFGELYLNRVEVEVPADDERASGVYEAVGFAREVVRREAYYRQGEWRDLLIMGCLREEFRCW